VHGREEAIGVGGRPGGSGVGGSCRGAGEGLYATRPDVTVERRQMQLRTGAGLPLSAFAGDPASSAAGVETVTRVPGGVPLRERTPGAGPVGSYAPRPRYDHGPASDRTANRSRTARKTTVSADGPTSPPTGPSRRLGCPAAAHPAENGRRRPHLTTTTASHSSSPANPPQTQPRTGVLPGPKTTLSTDGPTSPPTGPSRRLGCPAAAHSPENGRRRPHPGRHDRTPLPAPPRTRLGQIRDRHPPLRRSSHLRQQPNLLSRQGRTRDPPYPTRTHAEASTNGHSPTAAHAPGAHSTLNPPHT
jgi:hypothetical protein